MFTLRQPRFAGLRLSTYFQFILTGVLVSNAFKASAQPLSNHWNTKLSMQPYNTHNLGDKVAMIGVDENSGATLLQTYSADGAFLSEKALPQIALLGSSTYDPARQCFYVMGTNEDQTAMEMICMATGGLIKWHKTFPFSGYRLPYSVVQQNAQIAFTFGQVTPNGESTGLGWWLLDTTGNLVAENLHSWPPSPELSLPFVSIFTTSGKLAIATSSLFTGACSIFVLNPLNGDLNWSKDFNLGAYATIQDLLVDSDNNIYGTGENGFFLKLDAAGNLIYNVDLGYSSISNGYSMIEKNNSIYIFGGWRQDLTSIPPIAKMLVGKYDTDTGSPLWVWSYEHTDTTFGPNANSGFFINDSTAIIQFSRVFESDWLGSFQLSKSSSNIELTSAKPLKISPNPSYDGTFQVIDGDELNGRLSIYNLEGKCIAHYPNYNGERVSVTRNGIYPIKLESSQGLRTGVLICRR